MSSSSRLDSFLVETQAGGILLNSPHRAERIAEVKIIKHSSLFCLSYGGKE